MPESPTVYPVNADGFVENYETQVCRVCGEEKRLTEFYMHPRMGNGFLTKCKACKLQEVHDRRMKDLEAARAYDRKIYRKRKKK